MLADQLDRSGSSSPIAGTHRQHRISSQISQNPERINASFFRSSQLLSAAAG
jgi:hypothetical protein